MPPGRRMRSVSPRPMWSAFGLGNGGAHPGVVEVDDGDDGLTDIQDFSFAGGAHRDGAGDGRINLGVAETNFGLLEHVFGIGQLRAGGFDRALRGVGLVSVGDGGVQIGLGGADLVFQRLHHGLLRGQVGFCLYAILIGMTPCFASSIMRRAVALGAHQRGFCLKQLGARRLQAGLRVGDAARGRALSGFQGGLGFRDFGLHAVDGGGGGAGFGFEFGRIEHGDQVSLLDRSSFVHQQLGQTAVHLRADDHLVRIHGADEDQILVGRRGDEVVGQRDAEDDSENNEEFIANTHE